MIQPLYVDSNLRILPDESYSHLIGGDDLRWPKSFWIRKDKEDKPYYLVNSQMYAYIIYQVSIWKEKAAKGNLKKDDLAKSMARFALIKKQAERSLSPEERNYAEYLSKARPSPPKTPLLIPDSQIDLECQSRVYFAFKFGKRNAENTKVRSYYTGVLSGNYPSIQISQLPHEISRLPEFKNFLAQQRISEFVVTMAFDSYFSNQGRDLRSSVEFIDEMIRQKKAIPKTVIDEHKVRKKYLEIYRRNLSASKKPLPEHHQAIMHGFVYNLKQPLIVQAPLFGRDE